VDVDWRTGLWKQFGAAIDTLDDAVSVCPDPLWSAVVWKDTEDVRYGQFWFIAYHALFWLDLFLTGSRDGFSPPPPFKRRGLPERPYTKDQIRAYLGTCRRKCRSTMEMMTDEKAQQRCVFEWMEPSFFELQLYSLRHVQEHAAQLSLWLGQHEVGGLGWIASARDKTD
jgi:hypothetical protein